jgi:hypothetical protein
MSVTCDWLTLELVAATGDSWQELLNDFGFAIKNSRGILNV